MFSRNHSFKHVARQVSARSSYNLHRLTLQRRGFFQLFQNLFMCIFVCGGMIVSKAQLFAKIVLVFNFFTICWSIVTAIAVLNQDMWKACANDGSEGAGKYQQVRTLTDMRSCCGARESSTFDIAF
jgi:hypothetical protein